ncbi:homologous-pairing protein 2 homolog isoform X1 [Ylistrum balloti]|uniref:homologous-pairing protein 2 homolog isoform X1 n=1 Tax=Ylistrum balloti TaxID=509963 RepID=UPI002905CDCC|nr:homologous-pairing protein 2 homolog isoform X1 [Ylistrum balloti]
MSKAKDAQAVKAVLDYLNRQNRPYSAIDIVNNLHKEFGKTAVVKACEGLTEAGKIKEKVYGKQKVYVADQAQFPDVDDGEIKEMDAQISQLSDLTKVRGDEVRRLDSELKSLNNAISTEEAKKQLAELDKECTACKQKLIKLKEGGHTITPEEKDRIYNSRKVFVKEWRKRKRMANDILNAILEGYPKTKKQLYEDIGVETDEEYKVSPPEV